MSRQDFPPILLVEDNPDHALLTEAAIRHAAVPNSVTHLPDGEAAITYLDGGPPYEDRGQHPRPGLVLLDLDMPKQTGDEVIEWMRAAERPQWIRSLPVVVLTGIKDPDRLWKVRKLGADAVIVKRSGPGQFGAELRKACADVLSGVRQERPESGDGQSRAS